MCVCVLSFAVFILITFDDDDDGHVATWLMMFQGSQDSSVSPASTVQAEGRPVIYSNHWRMQMQMTWDLHGFTRYLLEFGGYMMG